MVNVYLSTMIIVFIIAYIGINSRYWSPALSKICTSLIFLILVFISGFRSEFSIGDTPFYAHTYRLLVQNPQIAENTKDKGFTMLMIFLNKITNDPQILIFFTAFITNLFIILTLYKYSKPFELGIFLYFTTVLYYVTMNGMRQSMVASLMFWAVGCIIKNQWKRYFLLILILSLFHQSVLIFLPLYFIIRCKAWGRGFWITLGVSIMMIAVFRPMLDTIVNILDKTSYSNYAQDMISNEETTNIIRVLIAMVPLILAYFVKDKLNKDWPESSVFIYMSLFNVIFMLFSTQYLYFYRLCIYFDLYNLILMPRLICLYSKQKRVALYVYIIILYTLFCWYQINVWNDSYRNILIS